MTTVHEQAADQLLSNILEDETAASTFAGIRRRIGRFDPGYVAAVGQMFLYRPEKWPLEQAAAFMRVHAKIGAGEVALCGIEVGAYAAADREREANTAALADLPGPFDARVDQRQNGGDYDGRLRWHEPIDVYLAGEPRGDGTWAEEEGSWSTTRAGWAPLEIGYTMPSRTLLHLLEFGAVARWPYDSNSITLLVDVTRFPIL